MIREEYKEFRCKNCEYVFYYRKEYIPTIIAIYCPQCKNRIETI